MLVEIIIKIYTFTSAKDVWIRISKLSFLINIDDMFNTVVLLVLIFLNLVAFNTT